MSNLWQAAVFMVHLLSASHVGASDIGAAEVCKMTHPAACRDINELSADPDLARSIHRFLKGMPSRLALDDRGTEKRILDNIGGPPDNISTNGSGDIMFSACRFQSCNEKSAILMTYDGKIKAIGVIYRSQDTNKNLVVVLSSHGGCVNAPVTIKKWVKTAIIRDIPRSFSLVSAADNIVRCTL